MSAVLYMDFETTGLDTGKDRIVELAFILEKNEGEREEWHTLINPGMLIPPQVTAIHGIRDEDVKNSPTFASQLPKIREWLGACDIIAGYNVIFDLKILMSEAFREKCHLNLHNRNIWDMQKIFFHHEPRNLAAAYRFYCHGTLDGAHRASNDVLATADIFKAQKERYKIDMTDKKVSEYACVSLPLDSNGAFIFNAAGAVELAFGKHKGKSFGANPMTAMDQETKNYLAWMLNASFPSDTKLIAKALLRGLVITRDNLASVFQGAPVAQGPVAGA